MSQGKEAGQDFHEGLMMSDSLPEMNSGRTVQCLICEKFTEKEQTFICRKCRKSPLCFEHLDNEYRSCSGCAAEERMKLHKNLMREEVSVRSFLRLTQFIFILIAIFFVIRRLFYEHVPDFLKVNIFFEYLFLWGGVALSGMALCYIMLLSQRQKIKEVEDKIQSHKVYSQYIHR